VWASLPDGEPLTRLQGVKRLLFLLCSVSLFASCGVSGSAPESPTFTLTPSGTAPSTLPPSSRIAALLPSFELLTAQLEQTSDGVTAAGLSEGALLQGDLPDSAAAGWKRTWQVTDRSGVSGVLELRAFAYYESPLDRSRVADALKLLTGSKASGAALESRTDDGRFLYTAAAPASINKGEASLLFTASLKLPTSDDASFVLVKDTAEMLAAAVPSSFSLPVPE
jgi:hypothetical protein